MSQNEIYLGNPNLKRANVAQNFTPEQVEEFLKCSQDPVYFIKNYIQIISLDRGLIPFELYDFQSDMVNKFHEIDSTLQNFLASLESQQLLQHTCCGIVFSTIM